MPQLDPEFFISQLFWLIVSFSFLLFFLWRVSLPRISKVLEKRENKINNDIESAKKYQSEAEKIQNQIDNSLKQAKEDTSDLINNSLSDFQEKASEKLSILDKQLEKKVESSSLEIKKGTSESFEKIHNQIYEITKLTLSKISNISANNTEIKEVVDRVKSKKVI